MPVTQRNFRANVAAKLRVLEAEAAALEHDAKTRNDILIGLGATPHRRRGLAALMKAGAHVLIAAHGAIRASAQLLSASQRTMRDPRLATVGRFAWGWAREGAMYVALAAAALLPFVLAILLLAPPD